jgi:hypothetical protein
LPPLFLALSNSFLKKAKLQRSAPMPTSLAKTVEARFADPLLPSKHTPSRFGAFQVAFAVLSSVTSNIAPRDCDSRASISCHKT